MAHQPWLFALWLVIRGTGLGASVLTRTAQQIGDSFGTAVILEEAVAAHHGNLVPAFHLAFWWSAGFAALAVLLSLWLPGSPRNQEPARAGRPAEMIRPPEVAGPVW